MKEISLSQGKVALVDDIDYEFLMQWKWFVSKGRYTWYAYRAVKKGEEIHSQQEIMHRALTGYQLTDHIDGNGLNNQRVNLREATESQNRSNMKSNSHNTTGYRGVVWDKTRSKWRAQIQVQGRMRNLGRYESADDAARAYNTAAIEGFGEFAVLNIIL